MSRRQAPKRTEIRIDPMDPSRADKWVYTEEDTPSLLPHLDRTRAEEADLDRDEPEIDPNDRWCTCRLRINEMDLSGGANVR